MKKLLTWGTVGLLTAAILDPVIYSLLDIPISWFRDLVMLTGGVGCFHLLIRCRNEL